MLLIAETVSNNSSFASTPVANAEISNQCHSNCKNYSTKKWSYIKASSAVIYSNNIVMFDKLATGLRYIWLFLHTQIQTAISNHLVYPKSYS